MNIEIFSCSGGMAEGFRRASVDFDLVIDKDPDAVASYEKNLGHRPVQMDARDFLRLIEGGWRPGSVDLIVADPPCTPWSRAGKRLGVDDERDMLGVTCEIIRLLKPRAYLIGNVPGLEDNKSWPALQAALAPLRKAGYCIADFACFDAADFGVPQRRIRPFWFGHLDGPCITWPLPTHAAPAKASTDMFGLKPWVTCRDALRHLTGEDLGRPVRLRRRGAGTHGHPTSSPDAPAPALTTEGGRDGRRASTLTIRDRHDATDSDSPSGTLTTKQDDRRVLVINDNPSNPSNTICGSDGGGDKRVLTWPWDRPATTVQRDERIAPPGHHDEYSIMMSDERAVLLSERAAAILQGFPETWSFISKTKRGRWSMIGQAMPPALAHAVATSVKRQMEATDLRKAVLAPPALMPSMPAYDAHAQHVLGPLAASHSVAVEQDALLERDVDGRVVAAYDDHGNIVWSRDQIAAEGG